MTVGLSAKVFDVHLLGFTSRKYLDASKRVQAPHPPQCAHWGTFPQGKAGRISTPSANNDRCRSFRGSIRQC